MYEKIEELRVRGFRSLGAEVKLRLRTSMALVGGPGSGASELCDALRFLQECVQEGLDVALERRGGLEALLQEGTDSFELEVLAGHGNWSFVVGRALDRPFRVERESMHYFDVGDRLVYDYQAEDGRWTGHSKPWLEVAREPGPGRLGLPTMTEEPFFRELLPVLRQMWFASPSGASFIDGDAEGGFSRWLRATDSSLVVLEEPERTLSPEKLPGFVEAIHRVSRWERVLLSTQSPALMKWLSRNGPTVEVRAGVLRAIPFERRD